jgi:hypothetical protein
MMRRFALFIASFALLATSPAFSQSCRQSAGAKKSAQYVRHCIDVSPATRPPCNAANDCELILDEIRRGCALLSGTEKPSFCQRYE